ncbi:MAG TPA: VWA domain-containing protein, partial [Burkholderiaceae bacterium]|nr:VWA domain-containing protein [Burkholderiaceae bacterium]
LSDGYDTGAPELLGEELRRLHQRAKRIVWLNPLLGRTDYAPIASGMQAALPHLDLLAPAHNLESLMKIEEMLLRL